MCALQKGVLYYIYLFGREVIRKARGQPKDFGSLLLPCGSWDSNSSAWVWQQVPLPTELLLKLSSGRRWGTVRLSCTHLTQHLGLVSDKGKGQCGGHWHYKTGMTEQAELNVESYRQRPCHLSSIRGYLGNLLLWSSSRQEQSPAEAEPWTISFRRLLKKGLSWNGSQ